MGAILAGGASSRFGSDKALALLAGRPLIAHAQDAIAEAVDAVVVCGREWGGLVSVADVPQPGLGPLGGIAGALQHAEANGFESVLTISCDMPEAPAELLENLLKEAPSYCADAPVLGHWPSRLSCPLFAHLVSVAPAEAQAAINDGLVAYDPGLRRGGKMAGTSVRAWAQSVGADAVASPVSLRNINRPADLLI